MIPPGLNLKVSIRNHRIRNHLEVLFGALHTTLPTIAIATAPIGYAIGLLGCRPWRCGGRFRDGLLTTCLYEFVHCIQHLASSRSPSGWPR
jgi:hypothetical protein